MPLAIQGNTGDCLGIKQLLNVTSDPEKSRRPPLQFLGESRLQIEPPFINVKAHAVNICKNRLFQHAQGEVAIE